VELVPAVVAVGELDVVVGVLATAVPEEEPADAAELDPEDELPELEDPEELEWGELDPEPPPAGPSGSTYCWSPADVASAAAGASIVRAPASTRRESIPISLFTGRVLPDDDRGRRSGRRGGRDRRTVRPTCFSAPPVIGYPDGVVSGPIQEPRPIRDAETLAPRSSRDAAQWRVIVSGPSIAQRPPALPVRCRES